MPTVSNDRSLKKLFYFIFTVLALPNLWYFTQKSFWTFILDAYWRHNIAITVEWIEHATFQW